MTTPPAEARLQQIVEQMEKVIVEWRARAVHWGKLAQQDAEIGNTEECTRGHMYTYCADSLAALLRGRSEETPK